MPNKITLSIIALLLFSLSASFSRAEEAKDCNETASTQAQMNACAGSHAIKADAELDEVYKKLIAKISPGAQAKLKLAKASWAQYRQQQCEFNSLGSVGGSVHPMVLSECQADLTRDYTTRLKDQLTCEEGDVSCITQ